MFTGLETNTHAGNGALVEDLAADPADLIDFAAAFGMEFRSVIADLLDARGGTPRQLIAALERRGPGRSQAIPLPAPPPFVWARIRAPHRTARTVRAGWLTAAALAALVTETRAAGPAAELDVIVPLDSGDAAVDRVRALCATSAGDVTVSVRVQHENADGRSRASRARAPRGASYRATWVVVAPLAATR